VDEMPDKEFKRLILKKEWIPRNTEKQLNKLRKIIHTCYEWAVQ
jgi:hypothetical protein